MRESLTTRKMFLTLETVFNSKPELSEILAGTEDHQMILLTLIGAKELFVHRLFQALRTNEGYAVVDMTFGIGTLALIEDDISDHPSIFGCEFSENPLFTGKCLMVFSPVRKRLQEQIGNRKTKIPKVFQS